MWCPDGYVLLGEVFEACLEISERYVEQPEIEEAISDSGQRDTDVASAYAHWAFARFIDGNEGTFFACFPNGQVVRLAGVLTEIVFPVDDEFDLRESNVDWIHKFLSRPFAFIEFDFFTIDTLSDAKRSEDLSMWGLSEKIRHLHGCPVCLKDTGNLIESILKHLKISEPDMEHTNLRPGRKKLRTNAARLFAETFPNGFEEVTLAGAARRLGFDRKTLREGLREAGILGKFGPK